MNKNRKLSQYVNVIHYNENTGAITIGNNNGVRTFSVYSTTYDNHIAVIGSGPSVSLTDAASGSNYQGKLGLATDTNHYASGAVAGDVILSSQTGRILFAFDSVQKASIDASGNITATSFKVAGGSSTGFLKADGSTDSTTYATAASVTTISSSLSGYVTLSTMQSITGIKTFGNETLFGNGITLTGGYITYTSGSYNLTLNTNILTANRNVFLQDKAGTIALTSDLSSYVPTSRTITINGTSYDLSDNRSWTIAGSLTFTGDVTGTGSTGSSTALTLAASGATAGTYGSSSNIPVITVDAKGRITSVSNTAVNIVSNLAGLSDVTLTSSASGQLLQYNGTKWVNWSPNYLTGITSTQVTTALGYTPLSSSGSVTIGGYLTVTGAGTSSSIYMSDSDEGQREIHCNSNRIGFLTQAGAWGAWCDDAGNWNAANFSGSSSGTNTGDQTNVSGNAGTATAAQNATFLTQANATWGARIQLGGNGDPGANSGLAVVQATDGNLHMDNGTGKSMYLNYYRNGTIYLNGSTYSISSNGSYYNGTSSYSNNSGALNGWGYTSYSYRNNGSGYYQVNDWQQTNGNYGIYWPSYYGLHIYPNNDGSYGSLGILGEKNGWRGIHFGGGSGMTLMMNETEFGFHRQGSGWYARFTSGRFYGTSDNTASISSAVGGGYTWTGIQYFQTNNGGSAVNNSNTAALQAYSTGNNTAFMSFHRGGYYAVNFGLDSDNWMRIGGWSAAANRWQLNCVSGDMVVNGDVTAFSDARVKENVVTVDNALSKVLALRGVYYTRIDSEDKKRKLGVIAQETEPIVPEVVNTDSFGTYNVSYGNLAGLFIEAFKEQQKQIEELKTIIDGLTR